MNKKKLTDDERQEIVDDYNLGMLVKDLVKKYCRKPQTIRKVLQNAGIKIQYNRNRMIPEATRQEAIKLYESGLSCEEVGKRLGIAYGSVSNIMQDVGKARPVGDSNPWTEEEVSRLTVLALDQSLTYYEISQSIGRSPATTAWKARSLNLPPRLTNGQFGYRTEYNGIVFRSQFEALFAKFLDENNVVYEYEKQLSDDRGWTCDFYLPNLDRYVEIDGMREARKLTDSHYEKLRLYAESNLSVVFINPHLGKAHWRTAISV